MTERCNLCGVALVSPESIDDGACWPTCDDLEFDRLTLAVVHGPEYVVPAEAAAEAIGRLLATLAAAGPDPDDEFDVGGEA